MPIGVDDVISRCHPSLLLCGVIGRRARVPCLSLQWHRTTEDAAGALVARVRSRPHARRCLHVYARTVMPEAVAAGVQAAAAMRASCILWTPLGPQEVPQPHG